MYINLVHALIFVSYRHSRYSFSLSLSLSLALISFFSFTLRHYLSHDYHSLSPFHYYICVYVFFYNCLPVRAYIDFSRRVFVAYTSSFHFRSVVYPFYARIHPAHVKEISS